jgi:hypothetical protein
MLIVSEPGLYKLIATSRKPIAPASHFPITHRNNFFIALSVLLLHFAFGLWRCAGWAF